MISALLGLLMNKSKEQQAAAYAPQVDPTFRAAYTPQDHPAYKESMSGATPAAGSAMSSGGGSGLSTGLGIAGTVAGFVGGAQKDAADAKQREFENNLLLSKDRNSNLQWAQQFEEMRRQAQLEDQARRRGQNMQGLTWLTGNQQNISAEAKRRRFRDQLLYS